jgi:predicted DCC family thiol-disulfide oxidoreductase YuxK
VVVNVESEDRNSADPNRNYSNREYLLSRSDAAIFILAALGGMSRRVTSLLRLMPEFLRDFGYRLLASQRYRMFGRYETCPLPSAEDRGRFLDPGD